MKTNLAVESVEELREQTRLPSLILWTGATIAGYGLGMTVSTYYVGSLTRPLGPVLWGLLNVLIYGAVIGGLLGILQFVIMPGRLVTFRSWLLASMAGTAGGFTLAAIAAEALANAMAITVNPLLVQGVIALASGIIIGTASGLAQWLALRWRLPFMRGWITASLLGMTLGTLTAAALLGLFEIPLLNYSPGASVGVIAGIFLGATQALAFWLNRER